MSLLEGVLQPERRHDRVNADARLACNGAHPNRVVSIQAEVRVSPCPMHPTKPARRSAAG
jgi:hypothetical protein